MFLNTFSPFRISGEGVAHFDMPAIEECATAAILSSDRGSSFVQVRCSSILVQHGEQVEDRGAVDEVESGFAVRVAFEGIKVEKKSIDQQVELWEKEEHLPVAKRHATSSERSSMRLQILIGALAEKRADQPESVFSGEVDVVFDQANLLCFVGAQSALRLFIGTYMARHLLENGLIGSEGVTLERAFGTGVAPMLRQWLIEGEAPLPFELGRSWSFDTPTKGKVTYDNFNLDLDAVQRYLTTEKCGVTRGSLTVHSPDGQGRAQGSVHRGGHVGDFGMSGGWADGETQSFIMGASAFTMALSDAVAGHAAEVTASEGS